MALRPVVAEITLHSPRLAPEEPQSSSLQSLEVFELKRTFHQMSYCFIVQKGKLRVQEAE